MPNSVECRAVTIGLASRFGGRHAIDAAEPVAQCGSQVPCSTVTPGVAEPGTGVPTAERRPKRPGP